VSFRNGRQFTSLSCQPQILSAFEAEQTGRLVHFGLRSVWARQSSDLQLSLGFDADRIIDGPRGSFARVSASSIPPVPRGDDDGGTSRVWAAGGQQPEDRGWGVSSDSRDLWFRGRLSVSFCELVGRRRAAVNAGGAAVTLGDLSIIGEQALSTLRA
jgi:hypothetical protein